jgi:hypothetical protein
MSKTWKSILAIALLTVIAVLFFRYHEAARTPLGDGPVLTFPNSGIPSAAERQFLASDFTIKDVKALPRPVLQAFTEEGGSRFTLANPGKEFLATDVIYDSSLPRKRLIFAGISGEKCFVHYEEGGIVHSFVLAFFRVTSNDKMEPVWRSYCGPAADIQDLRSQVLKGDCAQPLPQGMR